MVYNKKFCAGSFCGYKASKSGYFDVSEFFRVNDERKAKSQEMIEYTPPTVTLTNLSPKTVLTFSQGMLPNYTILPNQTCVLARAGDTYLVFSNNGVQVFNNGVLYNVDDNRRMVNYYFFVKDGRPLLSTSDNVTDAIYCGRCRVASHTPYRLYKSNCDVSVAQLSGTTVNAVGITGGYMDSLYTFPNQNENLFECDIILKVKTGNDLSGQQKLLKFGGFWFGTNDGKFAFAVFSSVVNGVTATSNKSYWLRVMQTGSDIRNYVLLYLEDDGSYTFDTLPGVGQWQVGAYGQFTNCAAHNNAMRFGDVSNQWSGTIDMLNCRAYIKYSGSSEWEEVWRAIDAIN